MSSDAERMFASNSSLEQDVEVKVVDDALYVGGVEIEFQRTLRVPADGNPYRLPPTHGILPVRKVADFIDTVPETWNTEEGVFLPMYQREAAWMSFQCPYDQPKAVKMAVGKVCALTGKAWSEELDSETQDYMVLPMQLWMDVMFTGGDTVNQLVAMPLGIESDAEARVSWEEQHCVLQICIYQSKPQFLRVDLCDEDVQILMHEATNEMEMGLTAGGNKSQKIYVDPHGVDAWDQSACTRVVVYLCNTEVWKQITGEYPPQSPVSAQTYAGCNLPWLEMYEEGIEAATTSHTPASGEGIEGLLPQQDDPGVFSPSWSVQDESTPSSDTSTGA